MDNGDFWYDEITRASATHIQGNSTVDPAHSSKIPTRGSCLDADVVERRYTSFKSGVESMRTHGWLRLGNTTSSRLDRSCMSGGIAHDVNSAGFLKIPRCSYIVLTFPEALAALHHIRGVYAFYGHGGPGSSRLRPALSSVGSDLDPVLEASH